MRINEKNLPPNKHLGYLLIAFFISGAFYFLINESSNFAILFLFLSFILFLITRLKDDLLTPLNRVWMKFGIFLSYIVSPVIFGIIFYGLFTPVSILLKIFGRDELRLNVINKKSHWIERKAHDDPNERFKLQF